MSLAPISAWPMRRLLAQGRDVVFKAETLLDNKENTCNNVVFEDDKENERKVAPKQKEALAIQPAVAPTLSPPQSALASVPLVCGTLHRTVNFGTLPQVDLQDTSADPQNTSSEHFRSRSASVSRLSYQEPIRSRSSSEEVTPDKEQELNTATPALSPHCACSCRVLVQKPSMANDRAVQAESSGAPVIPAQAIIGQAEYSVGDKVEYRSGTHDQWMAAKVTRLSFDYRGILTSYDLDVKRKALPAKIRWPVLIPSASTVPVPTKLSRSIPLTPDWNDLPPDDISKDAARALKPFKMGDTAEYWSSSYSQWMIGKVEYVHSDQITYDLDVKRGAHRRKMRSCAEDFSGLQKMHVHVIALTSGASP